jgi:hypothetical protein
MDKIEPHNDNNDTSRRIMMATNHRTSKLKSKNIQFIVDSGASDHMTSNREILSNYREAEIREIYTADGNEMEVLGVGDVILPDVTITDVLHIPTIDASLLSVRQMTKKGITVELDNNNKMKLRFEDGTYFEATANNDDDLYYVELKSERKNVAYKVHNAHSSIRTSITRRYQAN